MSGSNRESTLTLRAADLSSQPISQLAATLDKLTIAQKAVNESAKAGKLTNDEFKGSVQGLQSGLDALITQKGAFAASYKAAADYAAQLTKIAEIEAKRDARKAELQGGDSTFKVISPKEQAELQRFQDRIDKATEVLGGRFKDNVDGAARGLALFGESSASAAAGEIALNAAIDKLIPTLKEAKEVQLGLTASRKAASEAAQKEAAIDAEFTRRQRANNEERAASDKALLAAEMFANGERSNARRYDFEQAVIASDKEKSIQAEAAEADEAFARRNRERNQAKIASDRQAVEAEQVLANTRANLRKFDFEQAAAVADAEKAGKALRAEADRENDTRTQALLSSRQRAATAGLQIPGTEAPARSTAAVEPFLAASQSILGLVNPAAAARLTIDGLDKELEVLGATFTETKKRAEDYSKDLQQLALINRELQRQGGLVDSFKSQEAELTRLSAALRVEEQDYAALLKQQTALLGVDADLERRIITQIASVKRATDAYNDQNKVLTATGQALERVGLSREDTEAGLARVQATAGKVGELVAKVNAEQKGPTGNGTVLFGLRGYELQNLSYQINDVVTQLSSGTKITQVVAQQGGQIFQLFQRDVVAYGAKLKDTYGLVAVLGAGFVVAGAAVGVFTLAIKELDRASERKASLVSVILGDESGSNTVATIDAAAKATARLGASYGDAAKGARALAGQGFTQAQIDPLLRLSQQLSKATGTGLADSVKAVADAFSGGYDSIEKFSNSVVRIDAKTLAYIKTLFEQGKAEEARAVALDAIGPRVLRAFEAQDVGISRIFRSINNSIDSVLNQFERLGNFIVNNKFLNAAFNGQSFNVTIPFLGVGGGRGADEAAVSSRADSPGGTQSTGKGRGSENNNPGNLEYHGQENATREGGAGRFAKFADLESGTAAALRQYLIGQDRDKKLTVTDLIEKYTPPERKGGDNPNSVVDGYIRDVAKAINVGANDPINLRNRDTAEKYLQAVSKREGNGEIPQQVIERALTRVLGGVPDANASPREKVSAGVGTLPSSTNNIFSGGLLPTEAQKAATAKFVDDLGKETAKLTDPTVVGAASIAAQKRLLDEEDKALRERADKEAQRLGATGLQRQQVDEAVSARRVIRDKEFADARLKNSREGRDLIDQAQATNDKSDPTDLDKVASANAVRFKKLRDDIDEKAKGPQGAQDFGGLTFEQAKESVNRIEKAALSTEFLKSAGEITKAVLTQRDAALAAVKSLENISGAEKQKRNDEIISNFAPKLAEAARKSNEALDRANAAGGRTEDTEAGKAIRAQNASTTSGAGRPAAAVSELENLKTQAETEFNSVASVREDFVKSIAARLGRQEITLQQATAEYAAGFPALTEKVKEALAKATTTVSALKASPLANDAFRASAEQFLQASKTRLESTSELIKSVIDVGVKDSSEKLAAETRDRDRQVADVLQEFNLGLINVKDASARLSAISGEFKDKVKADAAKVVKDLETALATPGLKPGERADLADRLSKARLQANTEKPELQAQGQLTNDAIGKFQASTITPLRDTQATNAQLLTKGLITQTEAEESNKRAFEDANKAAGDQVEQIEELIKKYKALGASQTVIDNLRGKIRLINAELQYTDPLLQMLQVGIEQSIGQRGVQAFETVAQSIANFAVNGGKLKDVFRAVGQAFASFAAGVLEDIAKIILKYALLKLIKDALGISGEGGVGGGDGSKTFGAAGSPFLTLAKGVASAFGLNIPGNILGGENGSPSPIKAGETEKGNAGPYTSDGSGQGFSPDDPGGIDEASQFHSGGLVGSPGGQRRSVDMSLFWDARRMHEGGMVGLSNDEVPAILQRGERVQSINEVKQAAMMKAGGGSSATPVRNVLAVGDDEISKAMNGSHGEQVVISHIKRNAPTIRKLIG